MLERAFIASEALEDSLVEAQKQLGLEPNASALLNRVQREKLDALNDLIVEMLERPALQDLVDASGSATPSNRDAGYGMRIRRMVGKGQVENLTFYRVKASWRTLAINLVGLTLALGLHSPMATVPALNIANAFYENLVRLDRSKDGAAIDAYESLLRAKVTLLNAGGGAAAPSLVEIQAVAGNTGPAVLVGGLKRLHELGIVKVVSWGSPSQDLQDAGNRWELTI